VNSEDLIAMNGGAGVAPATPYQVKMLLNKALSKWTQGKITDIDQMPDYVNLQKGSSYLQLEKKLAQLANEVSSGRITDWKYLLPPDRMKVLNQRVLQWQAELNYRTLFTDARVDTEKGLGVALSQLSGGKVNSLADLKNLPAEKRAALETRLDQEVQKASGGDLKSYRELLDKASKSHNPGGPGYDPGASMVYATTGAVVAYNLLISAGMTSQQALQKIPGSFVRSFITASIAQAPTGIKDPYLQVLYKGTVGGVLTAGTNWVAGKVNPGAALPDTLNKGMVVAAFTTAGAVVGLNELQKRGFLGGPPPANPKDWDQWFHKYVSQSMAISAGLSPPVVIATVLHQMRSGVQPTPAGIAKNVLITAGLPFFQNLLANSIVNPPGGREPPAAVGFAVNTLFGMLFDRAAGALGPALGGSSTWLGAAGSGVVVAAAAEGMAEGINVLSQFGSMSSKNIHDVDQARQALKEIDNLLGHPYTFLGGDVGVLPFNPFTPPTGSREPQVVQALKQAREEIYKLHPQLRPAAR
jgi:hypothetical protein